MIHPVVQGALRVAGAAVLIGMLAVAAAALAVRVALPGAGQPATGGHLPPGPPALLGLVQYFERDAFVVLPLAPEWLQTIHVDARTVVTHADGPASLAAIRPGMLVAMWGERLGRGGLHARVVLVPRGA